MRSEGKRHDLGGDPGIEALQQNLLAVRQPHGVAVRMARHFEACHHHFLDGTDAEGALYGLADAFQPEMSVGWDADGSVAVMSGGEAHRAAGEAVKGVLLFLNCRS